MRVVFYGIVANQRQPNLYIHIGGEGEGYSCSNAWPWPYGHRPLHPTNAEMEHVGFSLARQTLLAPSAKRREVSGESLEG